MRYDPVDPGLFIKNRECFSNQLLPGSLAVFHSNDEFPRNGDQHFPFRQNSDFFYLSGIDQEQSILLLFPDCFNEKYREILFLRETNEHIAVWEGHKYTKEEAIKISGIRTILWLDSFPNVLRELTIEASHIYLNANENTKFTSEVPTRDQRFAEEMKRNYPMHDFHRSAPIITQLRTIKSEIELGLIRKACGITREAFLKVLKFTRPGVWEYEIEAEIQHEFIRQRSNGNAYSPIIASGKNACILHYIENSRACKDGDLLLLDFGAEYANYASDLSRTIPVNGKFTPRQKDCYNAILRIMKQAIKKLVPGATLEAYHKEVCGLLETELIVLGLFTEEDVRKQDPMKPLYLKYYPHRTSHFLGLDVHDVGFKQKRLEAGMLFSCEPGVYIPEEGIGIRIEDDILVTDHGPENLMSDIPVEIDEIEELMRR